MLKPEYPSGLKLFVSGDYFATQTIHKYCVAKHIRYSRDSRGRKVASMTYVVVVTNVTIQVNDKEKHESATVTGFIVGQLKQENLSLELFAEQIIARECGFVGTQISNLLALQGANGFPHFYKYMFLGYRHVLQKKKDVCSVFCKYKTPNEGFALELRQFVSKNVLKAGVKFYLESAFSSRIHSFYGIHPDKISYCQVIKIVGALEVIGCENRTREVTKDELGYYFAAVGPAGTEKTTPIRQLIYCSLSHDCPHDFFHRVARRLPRKETQDKNSVEIEDAAFHLRNLLLTLTQVAAEVHEEALYKSTCVVNFHQEKGESDKYIFDKMPLLFQRAYF